MQVTTQTHCSPYEAVYGDAESLSENSSLSDSTPGPATPDSTSDFVEPPPYETMLEANWMGAPPGETSAPELHLYLTDRSADFGSFLKGTVQVRPREDMLEPFTLHVAICHRVVVTKTAGLISGNASHEIVNCRRLCRNKIPVEEPLRVGFSYTIPFTIRFPEEVALPSCGCDDHEHLVAPPSLMKHETAQAHTTAARSLSMEYVVQAFIRGVTPKVSAPFKFNPSSTTMSLAHLKDGYGEKILREYSSRSRSRRRTLLRGSRPSLAVSSWPVYHEFDQSGKGWCCVTLNLSSDGAGDVELAVYGAEYNIRKQVFSCVHGVGGCLGSCRDHAKFSTVLVRDRVAPKATWNGRNGQIQVPYSLPAETFPLVPSHAGCFTAVVYEINVTVSHSLGTSDLKLPLIINNSVDSPPSYAEVAKLTSQQQACCA